MALALYRKYRPSTFAEVKGQEHVTGPLIRALENNRLHHAYLFSGPRGCGKTSSARILARSLNCVKGPTPEPCGVCESCVALAPDGPGSLDVIEIDAATHGLVDDARELREKAHFAPVSSRYKVYIIDEAHMLGPGAANALLKIIEEPPEFVKFVLATTEPDKLIVTIRSRTHHYPFRLVPPGTLRALLEDICRRENVAVEPTVLPLVVRAGGGSVRDSESILDQLLSGAGPEGITYEHALGLLGVTDVALLDDVVDALAVGDGAAVFEAVDRVVEAGHDPRRFATDLLERLRDLVVLDAVPDAVSKGLIDAPEDELARMSGQAARFDAATLSRMADVVHDGLVDMRGATSPRLLLELICARMLLPAASAEPSAVLQRLERLERRLEIGGSAEAAAAPVAQSAPAAPDAPVEPAPAAPAGPPPAARHPASREQTAAPQRPEPAAPRRPAPAAAEAPAPSAGPAAAAGVDAAAVRRLWPDVVAAARRRKQTVAAYLHDATVSAVEGDTLVLSFAHAFHAKALQGNPAAEIFADALHEVLGVRWKVRCDVGQAATPAQAGVPGFAAGDAPHDEPPDEPESYADDSGYSAPGPGGLTEPGAGDPAQAATQRSAEEEAIDLLTRSLGARPLDDTRPH